MGGVVAGDPPKHLLTSEKSAPERSRFTDLDRGVLGLLGGPPKHLLTSPKGAPAPLRSFMLTPLSLRNSPKRGGAQKPGSKPGPNPARCRGRRSVGVVLSGVRVVPRGESGVGSGDCGTSPGGIEPGFRALRAVVVPLGWSVAQQIESLLSWQHAWDESAKLVVS